MKSVLICFFCLMTFVSQEAFCKDEKKSIDDGGDSYGNAVPKPQKPSLPQASGVDERSKAASIDAAKELAPKFEKPKESAKQIKAMPVQQNGPGTSTYSIKSETASDQGPKEDNIKIQKPKNEGHAPTRPIRIENSETNQKSEEEKEKEAVLNQFKKKE